MLRQDRGLQPSPTTGGAVPRRPVPSALVAAVLALLAPRVSAAQAADSGYVPVVLGLEGSVRSAGLHGAGVALVGDAGSVFYNPACLATIRHIALEGGYFRDASGAHQETVAGALRLTQFDLGGGLKYYTVPADSATGGTAEKEYLATGSAVYRFGLFAFGASAKVIRRTAAGISDRAVGGDLGIAVAVFDIMALGFSVENVRGNWDSQSPIVLPRLTRLGFTMNYVDPQETFRLLSTVEIQWPESQDARVAVGVEGGAVVFGAGVLGRVAYGTPVAGTSQSKISLGGSVALGRLVLDYAYQPTGVLGNEAHRFGARLTL
jgi:hypothetical protein